MQKRTVLLNSLVALATSAAISSSTAEAAPGFVDGPLAQNHVTCPVSGGTWPAASTWVSYVKDPTTKLPSTGDADYMRAVVWNINPCNLSDTASHMFITLPETVSLATDKLPMRCFVGDTTGASSEVTCATPAFTNKGWDFGARAVPAGFFFEVRFPVNYNKWNGAIWWSRQLHVMTESTFGTIFANADVPIDYRPKFENLRVTANSNGFDATVGYALTHYNEAGVAYIAYSTDPNFASNTQYTNQVQTDPAYFNYPNGTATLLNLWPNTRYYWKIIMYSYLGAYGMSPVQSFVTPPASIITSVPLCRRGAC